MEPVLIDLAPSPDKAKVLDRLFTGPIRLIKAIEREQPHLEDTRSIKEFVMRRRRVLFANVRQNEWGIYFDFLVDFISRNNGKGENSPLSIRTVSGCSISNDNKIYIPLDYLRLIDVVSKDRIKWLKVYWEKENISYESQFTLVKINESYYCQIYPFKKLDLQKNKEGAYSFEKLWRALARIELEESQAYSRVDFDELEGKPIQGGGIEQGKKR